MKTDILEVKKYTAEDGYTFIKEEPFALLGKTLFLGINDDVSNYREVPDEEAWVIEAAYKEEQARLQAEEEEKAKKDAEEEETKTEEP